ncbi:MAG TPA: enolase C-terminal domain-like protein [Egibacteraceae bacterium]|nr:enolase C-terminal domain-like protein [Egibacteraceae bacterium]
MKIVDVRATTVTVPLEATIRHSNGAHWGRFVRTVVEVETDNGLVGLGEMGGGGQSAQLAFAGLVPYLRGHDPFDLQLLQAKLMNPTASLYNNRAQLHAAVEFACIDLIGHHLGVPAYQLFGGKVRDRVPFASYLFFRYPDPESGAAEVRTPDQVVEHARALKQAHGFTSHKLKGGVYPPDHELACYRALADAFPDDRLRHDPNAVWTVADSIRFGRAIAGLRNDWLEDPTWGLNGLRRVRDAIDVPIATNTVVVDFEQLATNVRDPAADVVLLDTTFWGGIRPCLKAAGVAEALQTDIAVHSSGELGIQLATMLHLGAVLPNLTFAADAHYHHLTDDVIAGGKLTYADGAIAVPTGPGLGVELDRDKLRRYAELYDELGPYPYDRDPGRPGWFSRTPATEFDNPEQPGAPRSLRST